MSSPAKHARDCVAAARRELERLNSSVEFNSSVAVEYGRGGHPKLAITVGDETYRLPFAKHAARCRLVGAGDGGSRPPTGA